MDSPAALHPRIERNRPHLEVSRDPHFRCWPWSEEPVAFVSRVPIQENLRSKLEWVAKKSREVIVAVTDRRLSAFQVESFLPCYLLLYRSVVGSRCFNSD